MLIKTHLAMTILFVLAILSKVEHKIIFVSVSLIAAFIPDIDSRYSTVGRNKINRIFQFFTKHRGIIHSFTFLILLTLVFLFFVPVIAFPFFLGYGLHLLADSFTVEGIQPFYPLKAKSKGVLETGGRTEFFILTAFILVDLFMLYSFIGKIY
jgi:inner membrane protein